MRKKIAYVSNNWNDKITNHKITICYTNNPRNFAITVAFVAFGRLEGTRPSAAPGGAVCVIHLVEDHLQELPDGARGVLAWRLSRKRAVDPHFKLELIKIRGIWICGGGGKDANMYFILGCRKAFGTTLDLKLQKKDIVQYKITSHF